MLQFYFNPWNDLALASGDAHYTPPASARQMADELQRPMEAFVLPSLRERLPAATEEAVWGWSPLARTLLQDRGVTALPTAEQVAEYRAVSSRQTAVSLLQRLRREWPEAFADGGGLVGESRWCRTEAEVAEAISAYGGRAMLKAPWSGSGRGVKPVTSTLNSQLSTFNASPWVRRTLRMQGGVEVEPYYDKVQDFAMEFWADGGRVTYEGLSLFGTTAAGVYAGNLVASEEEKERRLARHLDLALLHQLQERLEVLLSDQIVPAWYTGPLGVDMMVVHPPCFIHKSSFSLHPFIELNLRMTMGWVACRLAAMLPERQTGYFRIAFEEGHYKALFGVNEA